MGLFEFLKGPDINQGVEEFHSISGAVLLDVRTPEEYRQRCIPNSINIPIQEIERVEDVIQDRQTPIFVYCLSGNRAGRAVDYLTAKGYTAVKNIGGISTYKGRIEKNK